ncbi:MAG: tetratricopeptide repeat protein [Gemmatimonadota bacterium]
MSPRKIRRATGRAPGKPPPPAAAATGRTARWKLALLAVLSWAGFFAALEVGLWAGGVERLVDREDPFRGFSGLISVFEPRGDVYHTRLPGPGATFNDQSFALHKPAGGVRLFTLSGSSSYGFPWSAPVAFTAILGDVLTAAHPRRPIEAVNASGVSYAMHRLNIVADELCRYEPDIFIVYSGHNEFVEPEFFKALKRRSLTRNRVEYWLARTHVYSGMRTLLDRGGGTAGRGDVRFGERVRRDDSVTYSPAAKMAVVEEFRWRLQRLVRRARERGIKVVLCTVPCNLRDWRPEQSLGNPGLDEEGRRQWQAALRAGEVRLGRGDYDAALADLRRALELAPGHAATQYLMGRAYEGLGEWTEAQRAYQLACDEDASPSRRLSGINQAIREVAGAEGALLVDVDGAFAAQSPHGLVGFDLIEDYVHPTLEGHREIAWLLWRALEGAGWIGDEVAPQRAQYDAVVAARVPPDYEANPSWLYNQGVVLAAQGRDDTAIARFRQAVELMPTHGGALGNLVSLLLKQGRTDEALPLAGQLVGMYPDYPNFQMYLAVAYLNRGDLAAARARFEAILSLRAGDPMAHYQLGVISEREGDEAAAGGHYERAIARYGAFPEARCALGRLRYRERRYPEAQVHLEQAVAAQPDCTGALCQLGLVREELGDPAGAGAWFERALAVEADHLDALDNLAWLLATSGDEKVRDPAEALRLARRAAELTRYEGHEHLATLAAAAAAAGQVDEAVRWQGRAVALAPAGQAALLKERLRLYEGGQALRLEGPRRQAAP